MALIDNLIAAWELDEASGNAIDSHGANDLTETGGTIATGTGLIYGSARDFEADDTEWFTIADNTDVSAGDIDFSFELWIKAESLTTFRALFGKDNGGAGKEYNCYAYSNGNIQFNVSNSGLAEHGVVTAGAGSITTGNWIQVCCGHSATANETWIAINAGTPATTSYSGGVQDGTAGFQIGALDSLGSLPFDGLIGPVRFWKRDIRSDISELYNSGSGRTYAYITGGGGGATGAGFLLLLGCGA